MIILCKIGWHDWEITKEIFEAQLYDTSTIGGRLLKNKVCLSCGKIVNEIDAAKQKIETKRIKATQRAKKAREILNVS